MLKPEVEAIRLSQYPALIQSLADSNDGEAVARTRWLCRNDLYFLIRYVFGRGDVAHPWIFDRCREYQRDPDGYLDVWARAHYKSTIITWAGTIQDILLSHGEGAEGNELTAGIFSHTRPIAKKFLVQIKRELEQNTKLKALFPDVLYENPQREAPAWSLDAGIVVKRKGNPKEATVEAWGLVDSQPTAAHYNLRIYDDVVTQTSVSTPDMIDKTTEAWELSLNLGSRDGRVRYIGTRYHYADTYKTILDRKAAIERRHAATSDGSADGDPILLTREGLAKKRREMGPYTFAAQMLLDPKADEIQGFSRQWLKYYHTRMTGGGMSVYLLVDPASAKNKTSDYTAMVVIAMGEDRNYYVLDMIRDRLNLTERTNALFMLHRKWKPMSVGYERYGKDSDIEHIKDIMERENYRFEITEVAGKLNKADRIRRMIPSMEQGRWYFPEALVRKNYEGKPVDLITDFENELEAFPVGDHDDMIDCMSRIFDLDTSWPIADEEEVEKERYMTTTRRHSAWAT